MKKYFATALWWLLNYPFMGLLTLVIVLSSVVHGVYCDELNAFALLEYAAFWGIISFICLIFTLFLADYEDDRFVKGLIIVQLWMTILFVLISLGCYISGNKHVIMGQAGIFLTPNLCTLVYLVIVASDVCQEVWYKVKDWAEECSKEV